MIPYFPPYTYMTRNMEVLAMENRNLPRLETDGFITAGMQKRADKLSGKLRTPIKTSGIPNDELDIGYKKLLYKTGICAAIAIALLIVSSINNPAAEKLTETIGSAANHQLEIDEDIGRLKFVQNLGEESSSVFSAYPESSVVYPADGEIVTRFGESGSFGVRMTAQSEDILCIAKGTVSSVGEIGDAGYVTLVLDSGETAAFYNVIPAVKINDIVLPGQPLGVLSGKYLYFEMRDGEEYIDPLGFIKQQAVASLQ
ncbi:MAG: hypothetical protein WDA65_07280 [Christensenellales bacterium]